MIMLIIIGSMKLYPYLYHRYVRKHLGGVMEDTSEVDTLKKELDEAKAKITELKSKLVKYETEEATAE